LTARFARVVFTAAGIWGVFIMTPLYFAYDAIGRAYPPPLTHPDVYYGFVGVTLAWQVAFLVIATNPVRHRSFMPVAMLEKFLYVGTIVVLALRGEMQPVQAAAIAVPDGVLGLLIVGAFFKTPRVLTV